MPTVVLLDRSLSMMRPVLSDSHDQSRLSLACKGLSWFFDYLGEHFPLEYTSLLSFSSQCDIVVPFTRDYDSLKSKLEEITILDRTDLHATLYAMVEIISAEWGSFAPCQVVVVTDGSSGVRHQDSARRSKQPFCLPFQCQISAVCVSSKDELLQPSGQSRLDRLCELMGIAHTAVFIPNSPLNEDSFRGAFVQLAKTTFLPFTTLIKCGQLSTPVSLSPSPYMLRTNFDFSVSADQKFPSLEKRFPGLEYPNDMSVCGFIDTSSVPAPPHYCRHFVLDPVYVDDAFESGVKMEDSKLSEESQKPSFRVLLHGGLKCESKAALMKLGDDWYGLLFSQTSNSKKSNLVLCVFYPNADIPWLGPFPYLGPMSSTITDPRMQQSQQRTDKPSFPLVPSHLPSFHTPSNMLWAKEALLQTDVSKVIRYCRKLPDKEASLVKELNKLRLVSLTFHIPELVELLCIILGKEIASPNPTPPTKAMLQQCINFLTVNKNPQDRLVVTHKT